MIPQSDYDALRAAWDNLHNERAQLAQRIDAIDARIIELFAAIVAHHGDNPSATTPADNMLTTSVRTFTPRPGMSSVKEIQKASYEALERRGAPMHRQEIFDEIAAQGIRVGGIDTMRNFSAHLSHDRRFVKVDDRKGYWKLRKWEARERADATEPLPLGTAA